MKTARSKEKNRACASCGAHAVPADKRQCTSCGAWNLPVEISKDNDGTVLLSDASVHDVTRLDLGSVNPCFGVGGIVDTSTVLLGGAPGAGKSTLSLQMAERIARSTGKEVLYVAAEEALPPIRERAVRLGLTHLASLRMVPIAEGFDGNIGEIILGRTPGGIIIDSIAALNLDPEECVGLCTLMRDICVKVKAPCILIDHINKEEEFAGLMALQHAVDTLVTLSPQGDVSREPQRLMRTLKNRHGRNDAVCLEMTERGLEACPGCAYCRIEEDEEDDV
jgi:DNA repair protein RadA/Sms